MLDNEDRIAQTVYYPLIYRFVNTVLSQLKDKILAIALFGSVARNQARPDSDIDMIILLKEKNKQVNKKIINILIESYDWEENQNLCSNGIYTKIFTIDKTEPEFRSNPLILLDVLDHGIILYDIESKLKKILDDLDKKLKELKAEKIVFEDGKWCWDLKPDWKPGEVVEIKL